MVLGSKFLFFIQWGCLLVFMAATREVFGAVDEEVKPLSERIAILEKKGLTSDEMMAVMGLKMAGPSRSNSSSPVIGQNFQEISPLPQIGHHNEHNFQNFGSPYNQAQLARAHSYLKSGRCKHVYLDMGTNIGIQIRKLYQPEYYKDAQALKWFDEYFGPAVTRKEVCAFGVEANPKHTARLEALEKAYVSQGYHVVIFAEAAAGIDNGNITFFEEPDAAVSVHEWGASIFQWKRTMVNVTVGTLNIAAFLKHMVYKRAGITPDSRIVAKSDIEGYEYILIPNLLGNGALCGIDFVYAEFHPNFVPNCPKNYLETVRWELSKIPNCKCNFTSADDESYGVGDDPHKLPGERRALLDPRVENIVFGKKNLRGVLT